MRLSLLALFAGCLAICSAISAQPTPVQGHKSALVLYRSPFGFCFSLPENWKDTPLWNTAGRESTHAPALKSPTVHSSSSEIRNGPPTILVRTFPSWSSP